MLNISKKKLAGQGWKALFCLNRRIQWPVSQKGVNVGLSPTNEVTLILIIINITYVALRLWLYVVDQFSSS